MVDELDKDLKKLKLIEEEIRVVWIDDGNEEDRGKSFVLGIKWLY